MIGMNENAVHRAIYIPTGGMKVVIPLNEQDVPFYVGNIEYAGSTHFSGRGSCLELIPVTAIYSARDTRTFTEILAEHRGDARLADIGLLFMEMNSVILVYNGKVMVEGEARILFMPAPSLGDFTLAQFGPGESFHPDDYR